MVDGFCSHNLCPILVVYGVTDCVSVSSEESINPVNCEVSKDFWGIYDGVLKNALKIMWFNIIVEGVCEKFFAFIGDMLNVTVTHICVYNL